MGKEWKVAFPNTSNNEIREFLTLLTDAFSFSEKEKLKFEPQDKILDIYKACYPVLGIDSLELEDYSKCIQNKYSLNFDEIWNENLTLGELFDMVVKQQS